MALALRPRLAQGIATDVVSETPMAFPLTGWRGTLGWAPAVALRDGLARTIAYFDALLTG